jgi:hypothetical protein
VADLPSRQKIRADWESDALFSVATATLSEDVPLVDSVRVRAIESLTKGYGEMIADAVIAAADGYFDSEFPPTLRAWWIAVAREVRGRTDRDDRMLRRLGIRSLGRVIL